MVADSYFNRRSEHKSIINLFAKLQIKNIVVTGFVLILTITIFNYCNSGVGPLPQVQWVGLAVSAKQHANQNLHLSVGKDRHLLDMHLVLLVLAVLYVLAICMCIVMIDRHLVLFVSVCCTYHICWLYVWGALHAPGAGREWPYIIPNLSHLLWNVCIFYMTCMHRFMMKLKLY